MYYSLLQSTTLYYKVLLRPKRRQNDVHPVLLRTTKYYSCTASYYKVLLRTTKYYSMYSLLQSTILYYKVLLRPKRRPSSTTPYYKVLLQYYKVLLQYYSVLQSTTPVPQCTTPYYKVLFCTTKYYFDRNGVRTTSIQYYSVLQSTTPVLQSTTPALLRTTKYYSSTTKYYSVLQSTTPVLLRTTNVLLQYYSVLQSTTPVLQSTTLYYKSTTPVLLRPKRRQNDVHPVLLQYYKVLLQHYSVLQSTTPVLQSTTPYYKVLLQYYSVLQFRNTKYHKSFQNEHFVRDFLNFSQNKLPKRAFCARLPQLFTKQASKTSILCEASSTFQRTSFQNDHFVRGFLNFSRNKRPKRAFRARLPQLLKEQASKTTISCEAPATFQARSFQSLAPATQNAKMTFHLESLKRQNEHFVRDFLRIPHFQLENRRFCASFSYKAIFTKLKKYDFCEASATFQDNHQILRLPRYLQ